MNERARDLDNAAWLDHERSASLHDVGAPELAAVVGVHLDGSVLLLIAETARIGDPTAIFDAGCADAPHEQLGPLPARWRDRVALAPFYCGRQTLRGTRCRIPVTQPGGTCGWHRPQTKTTDTEIRDEGNTRL